MVSGDNAPLRCRGAEPETEIDWHSYTELNPDGTVAGVDQGIWLGNVSKTGNIAQCDKCLFAQDYDWTDTMYLVGTDVNDSGVYSCSLINSDTESFGHLSVIGEWLHSLV